MSTVKAFGQMQRQMQKWMAWLKELIDKGHIKDPGHPLKRAGKLVTGRPKNVTEHFRAALALARNPMERRFLEQRVSACEGHARAARHVTSASSACPEPMWRHEKVNKSPIGRE
jgi:hypothetical protein